MKGIKITGFILGAFIFPSLAFADDMDAYREANWLVEKYESNPSVAEKAVKPLFQKMSLSQIAAIYSELGGAYNGADMYDDSIRTYTICYGVSAGQCNTSGFAFAYYNAKKYSKAFEIGQELVVPASPNSSAEGYYILGISSYALGNKSEACTYWAKSYNVLSGTTDTQRANSYSGRLSIKARDKFNQFCN